MNTILGKPINTPNGPGITVREMWSHGTHYMLVKHIIEDMTSKDAGMRMTPSPMINGLWLWAYDFNDMRIR